VLPVLDAGHDLPLGGGVALQLAGPCVDGSGLSRASRMSQLWSGQGIVTFTGFTANCCPPAVLLISLKPTRDAPTRALGVRTEDFSVFRAFLCWPRNSTTPVLPEMAMPIVSYTTSWGTIRPLRELAEETVRQNRLNPHK
jgi:hypothetical protein